MATDKKVGQKGTALVQKGTQAVAHQQGPARGLEGGSDQSDLILPVAKLLQPLSPEVQEGGLKPGLIVNSISSEKLSSDEFIPLFLQKNFVKYRPREDGGGFDFRTNDPLDPRVQAGIRFGPNGEKPEVTAYLNFVSVVGNDFNFPIIIGFCKTSYKTGKRLYSLARLSGEDLFARKYRLSSRKMSNDSGIFWIFEIEPIGKVSQEEYRQAEQLYNALSPERNKIQAHVEGADEGL